VSDTGVLIWKRSYTPEYQLLWVDRAGKRLGTVGSPIRVPLTMAPRISPDGTKIALQNREPEAERRGLWVVDTARDIATRLSDVLCQYPQWSPDSTHVGWLGGRDGVIGIRQQAASGLDRDTMLLKAGAESGGTPFPADWSRDGRFFLYYVRSEKTRIDIWALPLFGDRRPYPVLNGDFDEREAQLSPDGRWIAYRSDVSGSYDIYVQSFTPDGKAGGERSRISGGGGSQPRFRGDGKELFYLADDGQLMAVSCAEKATVLDCGAPAALFKTHTLPRGAEPYFEYDVTRDGQRFLIGTILDGPNATPPRPVVALNWTAGLKITGATR
jgi:Tol biopolymer transport system component